MGDWFKRAVVYQVYPKSFMDANGDGIGDLRGVTEKLDYIHELGANVIWLNPIYKNSGVDGGYDISDYRAIAPEFGTMEDFEALVREIHARGMKCMIDVVYNHTSPDSVLYREHPEYFYRGPDGKPGNKLGDWADVIDLDYSNRGLWQYLTDTLVMWAGLVDGFRCDVASFVPVEFWLQARAAVAAVNPDCVWLAETVHRSYGCLARRHGVYSASDGEVFRAFDLEYEYDVREVFDQYLRGEVPLSRYLDALSFQEACYPANYNKLRFLENHDQPRIASFVRDERALVNYTAMLYFLKGTTLLYAGQEFENDHLPSLFDIDPIDRRTGRDLSGLLRRLYAVKQQFGSADWFFADADDVNDLALLQRGSAGKRFVGVFSLKAKAADVRVDAADGVYENLIDRSAVTVKNGILSCTGEPVILRAEG